MSAMENIMNKVGNDCFLVSKAFKNDILFEEITIFSKFEKLIFMNIHFLYLWKLKNFQASTHMEDSIVSSHIALLIGCLLQQNEVRKNKLPFWKLIFLQKKVFF